MAREDTYLIQDPYHPYAVRMMSILRERFGWRALTYYTDPGHYEMDAYRFPELLDPELVAASYRADLADLDRLVAAVRRDGYTVRAVVPYKEPSVEPSGRLAEAFGLSWSQPQVLARFRNKGALKAHLRAVDPILRVNGSQIVSSPAQAASVRASEGWSGIVLKPNDGFGNMDVGIFSQDPSARDLESWWQTGGHDELLAEEYVGGEEFHCDGQVDTAGNITVFEVARYRRGALNGRLNVEMGSILVPHHSGLFADIADYTTRVVAASGLRRSPFHCEVKVDELGPCLIECGARLVGQMTAPVIGFAHAGALDPFAIAAHYYATDEAYGPIPLDWQAYDSRLLMQVCGVTTTTERVRTLEGTAEVEQLPQFVRWLKRIEVGQRLHATTDMFGMTYVALLQGQDLAELDRTDRSVREMIRWNTRRPTLSESLGWTGQLVTRRLQQMSSRREYPREHR